MSLVDHKITVNERLLEYHISRRNDKYKSQRRKLIHSCIVAIRRLRNAPTEKDLYEKL